ncbi:MAG TPA: hypothetical protein VKU79_03450 [Thermoplasmataceae archaeon]|nr:hypothetical protein [Thermoplasmatales archaeon AK]HLH85904.1 hypothetical protein [Thermoplasmataceae archaeon]
MTGDRFNYYLKLIMNSQVSDFTLLSEQFENDVSISLAEAQELERVVEKHLLMANRSKVKVINKSTGEEEAPPRSEIDNFGNSADFVGEEVAFGITWKVYTPKPNFANSPVSRWYYNKKISSILNEVLLDAVPGRFHGYFDFPPWLLGTSYATGTLYMPVSEIINLAIARSLIPDWDYLVSRGIPKQLVDVLRTENVGSHT